MVSDDEIGCCDWWNLAEKWTFNFNSFEQLIAYSRRVKNLGESGLFIIR